MLNPKNPKNANSPKYAPLHPVKIIAARLSKNNPPKIPILALSCFRKFKPKYAKNT